MNIRTPFYIAINAIELFKSKSFMGNSDPLNLSGIGLEYKDIEMLAPSLQSLESLEHLDLSNNKCMKLPEALGELPNLKSLNVEKNGLKKFLKNTKGLSSLEMLKVSQNELEELPTSIGNLGELKVLKADRNRIRKIPPEIKGLLSLEIMMLWGNQIRILPKEIGEMQELKILSISYNQLRKFPEEISKLQKLEKLNADRNIITKIPSFFGNLKRLKLLSLWGCLIDTVPQELSCLKNLENLILDDNMIKELPKSISNMGLQIELQGNPLNTSLSTEKEPTEICESFEEKSLFASDTPYEAILSQTKSNLEDTLSKISVPHSEIMNPVFDVVDNIKRLEKGLNIISKYKDNSNEIYEKKLNELASRFTEKWKKKVSLVVSKDTVSREIKFDKFKRPVNSENRTRITGVENMRKSTKYDRTLSHKSSKL